MRMHPINVRVPAENFIDELNVFSEYQLDSCFGDGECMRVCPVVDPELTIAELNECTIDDNPLTEDVFRFTRDCIQCGACTLACPAGVQRDILMIKLKHKALQQAKEPKYLTRYCKAKGVSGRDLNHPERSSLAKEVTIRGFNLFAGSRLGKLRQYVDKKDFKRCHTLIYFGCYIFSHTGVQFKTIDLAERLGIDYEVLGGLKSCCGWPQLLAGRIAEAELLHRYVAGVIEKIQPQEIITGCMECYVSLKRMLQIEQTDWRVLTTTQWMLEHADELGLDESDEPVTFHDSCHCTRKQGLGDPARQLLGRMYNVVEMEPGGEASLCCGYFNLGSDPKLNEGLHTRKMEMAQQTGAGTMAVECITCQESFEAAGKQAGIEVTDLVDLVHRKVFDEK